MVAGPTKNMRQSSNKNQKNFIPENGGTYEQIERHLEQEVELNERPTKTQLTVVKRQSSSQKAKRLSPNTKTKNKTPNTVPK